jgi:hypothetical protein
MTGCEGSSGGGFGADARLKKSEDTLEVSWVVTDCGAEVDTVSAVSFLCFCFISQHFLNFLPDPHGQGSFLPIFCIELSGYRRKLIPV